MSACMCVYVKLLQSLQIEKQMNSGFRMYMRMRETTQHRDDDENRSKSLCDV